MKKKSIFLLVLAIALVLATSINGALAYFTSYVTAESYTNPILLGSKTRIEEDFFGWAKKVTIVNDKTSNQPVFVRVKAFASNEYSLMYESKDNKGKWEEKKDGYWYYSEIVYPGDETDALLIHIRGVPEREALVGGETFNVVVIYETTPVIYNDNRVPIADWSQTLILSD